MAGTWDFRTATDALSRTVGITLRAVADRFGVEPGSLSRWRREGGREPPPGWRDTLASMAEEAAREHRQEAERLEGIAREIRGG